VRLGTCQRQDIVRRRHIGLQRICVKNSQTIRHVGTGRTESGITITKDDGRKRLVSWWVVGYSNKCTPCHPLYLDESRSPRATSANATDICKLGVTRTFNIQTVQRTPMLGCHWGKTYAFLQEFHMKSGLVGFLLGGMLYSYFAQVTTNLREYVQSWCRLVVPTLLAALISDFRRCVARRWAPTSRTWLFL